MEASSLGEYRMLGIDIDDVLFETAPFLLQAIEKETGKSVDIEKLNTYSLEENLRLSSDILVPLIKEILSTAILEPVHRAVEILNMLDKPICFISNRHYSLVEITMQNIRAIGLTAPHKVFLLGNHHDMDTPNKAYIINMYSISVFIEDNPDVILDVYNRCSCDILVFDRPWNRHIAENNRIVIVRNWNEIREFIQ